MEDELMIEVEAGGLGQNNKLIFDVGMWEGGDIQDGILIRLPKAYLEGAFTIAFDDLEKIYLAAKKAHTDG